MLDVGWPELIVIGAVALVAVGPKELPRVMHTLGRMAGKARAVMHDFRMSLDQVVEEAEKADKAEQQRKRNSPEEKEHDSAESTTCPPPLEGGDRGGVYKGKRQAEENNDT